MTKLKAVSLFSGAGGFDVGFHKADFETVWANDINDDACDTLETFLPKQVVHRGPLEQNFESLPTGEQIDVVIGGPPCQGFSVAGYMDLNDPRSELVFAFMKVVRLLRPRAFVLENVKALAALEKFKPIRERLRREAKAAGYDADIMIVKSSDFDVSQARERMLLVGFKEQRFADFKAAMELQQKPAKPLRETIGHLGRAGTATNARTCRAKVTIAQNPVLRSSPYAGMLFNGQGRPLDPDGYSSTLPASMGGNRTPIIDEEALYGGLSPWVIDYHERLVSGGMVWRDREAPKRLRRLTVDEAAAIQTFPSGHDFQGKQSSVYSQIGNAVPCELARRIGESVKAVLQGFRSNSIELQTEAA